MVLKMGGGGGARGWIIVTWGGESGHVQLPEDRNSIV